MIEQEQVSSYRVGVAAAAAGSIPGCPAHIPTRHRRPTADRVAVLQGVCDTAGRPGRPGQVIVTTSSGRLAGELVEIVDALGGTARTAPAAGSGTKQEKHRIELFLPARISPFRDPVKAAGYQTSANPATTMRAI